MLCGLRLYKYEVLSPREVSVSLIGKGVLAIWNGIDPEAESEFVRWHVEEHIPERVGLPGFLRGRRYVAIDGSPKFFNFYETNASSDLSSPIYRARLDAPTDWTKSVVKFFRDTSRTICDVSMTLGCGGGAYIETLRLDTRLKAEEFKDLLATQILLPAAQTAGVVGVHLLEGQSSPSGGATAENQLRSAPDEVAPWVVLIETVEPDTIRALREGVLHETSLRSSGVEDGIKRGMYALQFSLTKAELAASQRSL
jgi:hypothetical protein